MRKRYIPETCSAAIEHCAVSVSALRISLLVLVTLLFVCGAMMPGELREMVSEVLSLGGVDAYAHLFFCSLIALLLGWAGMPMVLVFVSVLVIGGLIELTQLWIPGRSTSWNDMVGNAGGTVLGLLLFWLARQFLKREKNG